jgi:hypothetical protein
MAAKPTTNIHESAKRILAIERKAAKVKKEMDEEKEMFEIFKRSCKHFSSETRFGNPQGTGFHVQHACNHPEENGGFCIPELCPLVFEKSPHK